MVHTRSFWDDSADQRMIFLNRAFLVGGIGITEEDMRQFFSGDMMILDGQRIDELAAAIGQDDWKDLGIELLSEQILKSDKNLTDFIRRFRFQEKSRVKCAALMWMVSRHFSFSLFRPSTVSSSVTEG